ncbi:MAG: SMI1/KNR4 family protein [Deltaproteobacteria bacterium]|nr:SMI1/KNR4 family protein [Deltaproteobacteria bacterium]
MAERYVGQKLPRVLRDLLMERNGGVSNYAAFQSRGRYFPLLPFFSVEGTVASGSLMRAFDVRSAFGVPEHVVPFAGQGEAWWGLDYRLSTTEPAVVFRQDADHQVEQVAASFAEFMNGLTE